MSNTYENARLGVVSGILAVLAAPVIIWGQTPDQSSTAPIPAIAAPAQAQPHPAPTAARSDPTATAGAPITAKVVDPQFKPTPEQVGDSLMAHQRYQAAIESYKKAPRDSAEAWNKMGVAYQLMLNLDEAVKCYQQALRLESKNAVVMNNLGTIYVSQKQYSNAEKMYRKALKADPQSALVHKNMGTALLAERKYKKGWQEYQAALAIDPQIFEHNNTVRVENPASVQERGAMNYYMAKGCVKAGQTERAIEYLRQALNEGFTSAKKIEEDSEFAALRDVPAFQEMLAAQRAQ
jgi:tetratricopeptide (TPR) repeat protein